MRENLTSSSYGEGLETGHYGTAPVLHPTVVLQGDQTEPEDQNLPRDKRQCRQDPDMDGPDRHASLALPAADVDFRLVAFESRRPAAAPVVRLPGSSLVAERSFRRPTAVGKGSCNPTVSGNSTVIGQQNARNRMKVTMGSAKIAEGIGQHPLRPEPQNQQRETSFRHSSHQDRKFNGFNNRFSVSRCLGQQ